MANNQKGFLSRYRLPVLVSAVTLVAVGIFLVVRSLTVDDTSGHIIPSKVDTPVAPSGDVITTLDTESQLLIHLSEGQEQPQVAEPLPVATGEPLANQDLQRILARLPVLTAEPDDGEEFRLPDDVLPPPLTGETIEKPFPTPPKAAFRMSA